MPHTYCTMQVKIIAIMMNFNELTRYYEFHFFDSMMLLANSFEEFWPGKLLKNWLPQHFGLSNVAGWWTQFAACGGVLQTFVWQFWNTPDDQADTTQRRVNESNPISLLVSGKGRMLCTQLVRTLKRFLQRTGCFGSVSPHVVGRNMRAEPEALAPPWPCPEICKAVLCVLRCLQSRSQLKELSSRKCYSKAVGQLGHVGCVVFCCCLFHPLAPFCGMERKRNDCASQLCKNFMSFCVQSTYKFLVRCPLKFALGTSPEIGLGLKSVITARHSTEIWGTDKHWQTTLRCHPSEAGTVEAHHSVLSET